MNRKKSRYVCQQCGFESLRWLGRCPECESWNSMVEEFATAAAAKRTGSDTSSLPQILAEVKQLKTERLDMGMAELNRVLGGGLVPGTVVLLAGDPGIGKSTLLLQAAAKIDGLQGRVLYISGEESTQQIKLRAVRMGLGKNQIMVWAETDLENVIKEIKKQKPDLVIIDSIQTIYIPDTDLAPGSVSQIREATAQLVNLSKSMHIPVIIVGHVTKEGGIAGPRLLEHMVDTVLYFEGDRRYQYRILRTIKNRFGSTAELGVFEMSSEGLIEVPNPSSAFLAERPLHSPGSVVAACMEGSRPLLIEIQALVSPSPFGQPRRMMTGIDYNRANLILAVLEKKAGFNIAGQDVYVNIAGGIRIQEPAIDLAIAMAIVSSFRNKPCPEKMAVVGEVGLTGEIRGVAHLSRRMQEIKKLGFSSCLIPAGEQTEKITGLRVIAVKSLEEALRLGMDQ